MGRKRLDEEDDEEEEEEDLPVSSKKKRTPPSKKSKSGSSQNYDEDVTPPSLQIPPTKYPYHDLHRAVLQLFLAKKVIEDKDLANLTKTLGRDEHQDLPQLVREINDKLLNEDMYMQIRPRQMVDEDSNCKVWGLVTTIDDDVSREATSLEKWQLALFNVCLQIIAKAEDGTVSHIDAVHGYNNIKDRLQKPGNEILQTMQKLAALGWLRPGKNNMFTVGARSLIELREVLREMGAPECPKSHQIVVKTRAYKEWLKSQGGSLPTSSVDA